METKRSLNPFTFRLEKPRLGKSTRFSREFGSRRLLSVSLPDNFASPTVLKNFFKSKFVLLGHVFQAIYPREGSCYLLETGDYEYTPPLSFRNRLTSNGRLSLMRFAHWHNPVGYNKEQVILHLLLRMAFSVLIILVWSRVSQNM